MSLVPVFIKYTSANPLTIGFFRLFVATCLMLLISKFRYLKSSFKTSMIVPLMIIGLLFAAHWITYFVSIKKSSASIGILGMSTYGIHLMLLGWLFGKSRPGGFDVLALIFAIAGTTLIIPELSLSNDITSGLLIGILSGLCFAALPLLHQRYVNIPEKIRILGQFIFALLLFLIFFPGTDWQLETVDWWVLTYLAIPGTFIAHGLWVRVTTHFPTVVSSVIFYLIIPMTMTVSYFWLEESMTREKLIGATLVVIGNLISILNRVSRRGRYSSGQ